MFARIHHKDIMYPKIKVHLLKLIWSDQGWRYPKGEFMLYRYLRLIKKIMKVFDRL